ncbi:MAG: ATP-dependent helicase C-terminal domain-containing protein, partial [Pseudomonadales bacterium]
DIVAKALLVAFPDRLARRRKPGDSKGRMVGGRGVRLGFASGVQEAELFLCIDVDDIATEANVRQASGIDPAWLPEELTVDREEQFFNPTRKQVEARRRRYWSDLMLSEQTAPITDEQQCRELLFAEACKQLPSVLPDDKSSFHSWLTRMDCLRTWAPELEVPPCNDQLLTDLLQELCPNKRSFAELKAAPWLDWLKSRLTPAQLQAVDRECPEKIEVPSGSRIKLDYTLGKPPVLAVRIQEIFSWTETPRIAFGRVPILLHLLAPNFRPQQVTDDLASFWANTYEIVRKELRRRYPKHSWPEDPLTAKPECRGGASRSG